MALYKITPKWKKSYVETTNWSKEFEDGSVKMFDVVDVWRWGSVTIDVEDKDELPPADGDYINFDDYIIVDFESNDCSSSEIVFDDQFTDEDIAKLEELFYDEGYSGLEEDGWIPQECTTEFNCEYDIELIGE